MGHSFDCLALTLVLALVVAPSVRADYEAGQRAWDTGQTEEALAQWRSAADAGDRRAMFALGRLHVQGLGVLQDYVEAHKWLNLAASRGEVAALEERDAVAAKMTPEERAEAQRLARAWRPGGGQAGVAADAVRGDAEPATAPVAAWEGRPPTSAVREVQSLLGSLGYRAGPADGIWGRRTGEAYRTFLRDAGLPVVQTLTPEALAAMRTIARREGGGAEAGVATGTVTPQVTAPVPVPRTASAAPALIPQITIPASPPPPPPSAIREAQALLAQLGYAPGPADGRWGEGTARAYRAFLPDAGLPLAEVLTVEALHVMRAMARRQGGGETARGTAVTRGAAPGALHRAAQAGDINGLKAALAAGVDVDALDGRGRTALMHAVDKGYTLLVEPLLEAGAAPDTRAPDGATALFMAVAHGHTEIVAMLMRAGAEVSVQGPKGKTAVDVARMRYGEPEAAREKGMDVPVLALLDGKSWAELKEEERRKADDAAWARAERLGTAKSYGEYASTNPEGRHVGEARRREAALRAKAERAERLARKWTQGTKLRDCEGCPELVVIPAGKFRMGSPFSEKDRQGDEGPVHDVKIWEPFAVGIHEVTRDEFAHFVKETGRSTAKKCRTYKNYEWKERSGRSWKKPGFKQDGNHPVVCVSWDDAKAYAGWLSRKTGEQYRLLSESEWEYAARAGTSTAWHWGAGESGQCRYANGADKAAKKRYSKWKNIASCNDKHVHTSPVGTYQPNGFGLYDMSGNVWEWVEDCWHGSYGGAPTDRSAWTRGGDCSKRVLRGGSWLINPGASAPPTASGTPPGTGAATSGSVLPGRSPLESLFLYLVGGSRGELAPPWPFLARIRTRTPHRCRHPRTDRPWIRCPDTSLAASRQDAPVRAGWQGPAGHVWPPGPCRDTWKLAIPPW